MKDVCCSKSSRSLQSPVLWPRKMVELRKTFAFAPAAAVLVLEPQPRRRVATLSPDIPICLIATAGGWPLRCLGIFTEIRTRALYGEGHLSAGCTRGLCVCVCGCVQWLQLIFAALVCLSQSCKRIHHRCFRTREPLFLTAGRISAASDLVAIATTLFFSCTINERIQPKLEIFIYKV